VTHNGVVAAAGRLTDWISLGVLASSVPRDPVDAAVTAAGKDAKRPDGKLPPHVMAYFVMALALLAGEVYRHPRLGHVRRKMLRVGLPPVLDDLDQDGTLRPGSTLRPKSLG
jgi:hypothetical protein